MGISITAIAAAALLAGVASAIDTTEAIVEETVAWGLAQQLMDEVAGVPYAEAGQGPYQATLGLEGTEGGGKGRERYDDLDDFAAVKSQPPRDLWGIDLGKDDGAGGVRNLAFAASPTCFSGFREQIDVFYLNPTNLALRLPQGRTSDYRAVEVRILSNDPGGKSRPLVEVKRVFAYVPAP